MPELPEVEIAARNLRAWGIGRTVESVEADPRAARIFRPSTPAAFAAAVRAHRLDEVRRRGKHLLLTFSARRGPPLGVHAHLGMTGKWVRRADGEAPPSHVRARLALDDGSALLFRDPRLFGRLEVVPGARFDELPDVAALGPDPLDDGLDVARLAAAFARRKAPVKVVLLDQALLPGVGNIHASEALHRARIDPRRPAVSLSRAEVKRLAGAVMASITESIARDAGPEITYVEEPGAENRFLVYGHEGEPCPRCGKRSTILREVQGQRSTFYCPRCQR